MEHSTMKRAVLKAASTRLEQTAIELQERIEEIRNVASANDDSDSPSQRESTRGGDLELMESLSEQLLITQKDLDQLQRIDPTVKLDVVQYGAVVHTNERNFLIGASLDEFDAIGKYYLGVSTKAPLIQELTAMSVGERVTFSGIEYIIEDIF